ARQWETNGGGGEGLAKSVWHVARAQNRPGLQHLAKLVVPAATWADLVLPAAQHQQLAEMASQAAHRATVYGRWGFARPDGRGLGITALFAGPSGTGKTLAAEVVAGALRLDLC